MQEPVQVSDIYSSPLLLHVILLLKVKVLWKMSSLFIKLIALNDLQQSDCIVGQNGFKKLCILFIGVRDLQRAKTNFLL